MADALKVKLGSCSVFFDNADLGYTVGGVKVSYTVDTFEKSVDQEDSPIDELVTKQNFEVTVPMAEYNLAKLVQFIPGAVLLGDNATNPGKMKLIITGEAGKSLKDLAGRLVIKPKGGTVNDWITVYAAVPKPNIEFAFEKENTRVYNVVFRALKLPNAYVSFGDTSLVSTTPGVVQMAGDATIPASWYDEPTAKPKITSMAATPATGITTSTNVSFSAVCIGTPTDYLWDFGDGYQSAAAAPSHKYASTGTYDVTLTVWNASGQAIKKTVGMVVVA
jgi:PKD repeat protein